MKKTDSFGSTKLSTSKKTLFLDRDGVININHGYVHTPEKFEFIEGIFDLCRTAQQKGYQIIIVTNQSGIARKYYNNLTFKQLSKWLTRQFWQQGIKIKQILHCPHHPKFTHSCCCRKPRVGMIIKAQKRFHIDLSKSMMIGDSLSDMKCAQVAKIKKRILFKEHTQSNNQHVQKNLIRPRFHTYHQVGKLSSIKPFL